MVLIRVFNQIHQGYRAGNQVINSQTEKREYVMKADSNTHFKERSPAHFSLTLNLEVRPELVDGGKLWLLSHSDVQKSTEALLSHIPDKLQTGEERRRGFQFLIYIHRNYLQSLAGSFNTASVDMNCIPYQSCSSSTLLVVHITASSSP